MSDTEKNPELRDPSQMRILIVLHGAESITMGELSDRTSRMRAADRRAALAELQAAGLVNQRTVHTPKSGPNPVVLETTKAGAKYLKDLSRARLIELPTAAATV